MIHLMRFSAFGFLVILAGAPYAGGAEPPSARIANGQISASLYLPDPQTGFYRGTRFDWSGVIYSLEYKGHNYFAPWFQKERDDVHDFVYEGADIVAGPNTAITGPVEEFFTDNKALGYDEGAAGGLFIKIGVGELRKKDAGAYDHFTKYEVVNPGKWTVKSGKDSVEFTQVLDGSAGYSYVYKKTVRLVPGKPEMVIAHSLKNTGKKAIVASAYDHNFLSLDHQPAGPGYSISFPFTIQPSNAQTGDLAEIQGTQILYKKALAGQDRVMTLIGGYSDRASDYDFRVESTAVGAGMHVTGNRPLSKAMLWSIRPVVSVEPYIDMSIQPGREFTWDLHYAFYTLAK